VCYTSSLKTVINPKMKGTNMYKELIERLRFKGSNRELQELKNEAADAIEAQGPEFVAEMAKIDCVQHDCAECNAREAQPVREPLPSHEIVTLYAECPCSDAEMIEFAREVEKAHGIGGDI
jgi:hypothetical protein